MGKGLPVVLVGDQASDQVEPLTDLVAGRIHLQVHVVAVLELQLVEVAAFFVVLVGVGLVLLRDESPVDVLVLGHVEQHDPEELAVEPGVRARTVVDLTQLKQQVLEDPSADGLTKCVGRLERRRDLHGLHGLVNGIIDVDRLQVRCFFISDPEERLQARRVDVGIAPLRGVCEVIDLLSSSEPALRLRRGQHPFLVVVLLKNEALNPLIHL